MLSDRGITVASVCLYAGLLQSSPEPQVRGEPWKSGLSAASPGAWLRTGTVRFQMKPTSRRAERMRGHGTKPSLSALLGFPRTPTGSAWSLGFFFSFFFSNAISFIYSFILYNPNGFTCLILLPYQLIDQSFFRSNQERELTLFLGMLQVDYEASSLLRIKLCQHKIQYVNVKK